MSGPVLALRGHCDRLGLKGPRAGEWLAAQGVTLPAQPNTWAESAHTAACDALLVARLGASEFFIEDAAAGSTLKRMAPVLDEQPPGVYPVLREDWAFSLGGEGVHEVLEQVCNVNFTALALQSNPVIMTLMIGVAVLVVPRGAPGSRDVSVGYSDAARQGGVAGRSYGIWCDPTFGPYLGESLGEVVIECGGSYRGVSG